MFKFKKYIIALIVLINILFVSNVYASTNPVDVHGKLSVKGTKIVDKNGNAFQLRGVSTHGLSWYPEYVNENAFAYMRDEWGINAVRLAMYSDPSTGRNSSTYELVKKGVEYAKNAGLYVIIDWHILNDFDPNTYKSDAIDFFKQTANLYKNYDNVLYEICNEPHWVSWETSIKPYAEEVIEEIRKIDDDAIIIVGTPTWSQDVDIVSQNPITKYNNLVYTLHFYAGTHKDDIRNKLKVALNNNLPVLVSEFGGINADGNGSIDYDSVNKWIDLLDSNDIGYFIWQLSNKNEGASLIKSNVNKLTGWTYDELSNHGKWFVDRLKKYSNDSITDNNDSLSDSEIQDNIETNNQDNNTNDIIETTDEIKTTDEKTESNKTEEILTTGENYVYDKTVKVPATAKNIIIFILIGISLVIASIFIFKKACK